MKKIILICATTILSLSFINAQRTAVDEEELTFDSRHLLLGVTAGVNMTTYSGDRNPEMGLGGQIGINCDVPVNENFSIMPELIFAYNTVKLDNVAWDVSGNVIRTESTDNLLYMNVPVTVKWSTPLGAGRPFIAAGPMLNVGLYGVNKIKDSEVKLLLFQPDPNSDFREYREEPIYTDIDFSAYVKVGYDFDFGLSVSAALRWGFMNMYKMNDERKAYYTESGLDTSQTSKTVSFSLGYNF
jgi:hypothetical protein